MDQLDRDILNIIQSDLPICERPYAEVGRRVGLDEAEVLGRIQGLKDRKIIRRIGGNASSGAVGHASTLCAARVPEERFEAFVAAVNRRPGVTHNYQRDHDLNVWFTLIAPSKEALVQELADIEAETRVAVLSLPALKTYKIQVDFEV